MYNYRYRGLQLITGGAHVAALLTIISGFGLPGYRIEVIYIYITLAAGMEMSNYSS